MKRLPLAAAGAVAAVAALGGYLYASHVADARAEQEVRRMLQQAGLESMVDYRKVGYGLLSGTVSIDDVTVRAGDQPRLAIRRLQLADLDRNEEGWLDSLTVEADGIDFDLLGAARSQATSAGRHSDWQLIVLGYYRLNGSAAFEWRYDPVRKTAELAQEFDLADLGTGSARLRIGGMGNDLAKFVSNLGEAASDGDFPNRIGGLLLAGLALNVTDLALADLQAEFKDDGLMERVAERLGEGEVDPDVDPFGAVKANLDAERDRLTRAGVDEAVAERSAEALKSFLDDGGRIRLVTEIEDPVQFLSRTGILGISPTEAFQDPAAFIRRTGAHLES